MLRTVHCVNDVLDLQLWVLTQHAEEGSLLKSSDGTDIGAGCISSFLIVFVLSL